MYDPVIFVYWSFVCCMLIFIKEKKKNSTYRICTNYIIVRAGEDRPLHILTKMDLRKILLLTLFYNVYNII